MKLNEQLLDSLFEQAHNNPRLRQSFDLRTSVEDSSQRMLNALLPGTEVAVHKHPHSSENVICLCGRMEEVIYSEDGTKEVDRILLCPSEGQFGCVVPADTWHTVEVFEPSVIYEGKDGKYGEDGSTSLTTSSSVAL